MWCFILMLVSIKARLNLEERNSSLSEQVSRLKDENRNLESRRSNLEQENQRLNREYTDMFKKLSVAEASQEVSSKVNYTLFRIMYFIIKKLLSYNIIYTYFQTCFFLVIIGESKNNKGQSSSF